MKLARINFNIPKEIHRRFKNAVKLQGRSMKSVLVNYIWKVVINSEKQGGDRK